MTFGDDMKRKADEVHLQEKAKDFGDAVAELVKAAVGIVGGFAAENREKVDGALDKAQEKIGDNTSTKHSDTVVKVRAQVDRGLDKLVEQRDKVADSTASRGGASGTGGPAGAENPARPGAAWPTTPVPDDMHSAFDDNDDNDNDNGAPAGSPS